MKLIKTASGKQRIKISKSEWKAIGKEAGWGNEGLEDESPFGSFERMRYEDEKDRLEEQAPPLSEEGLQKFVGLVSRLSPENLAMDGAAMRRLRLKRIQSEWKALEAEYKVSLTEEDVWKLFDEQRNKQASSNSKLTKIALDTNKVWTLTPPGKNTPVRIKWEEVEEIFDPVDTDTVEAYIVGYDEEGNRWGISAIYHPGLEEIGSLDEDTLALLERKDIGTPQAKPLDSPHTVALRDNYIGKLSYVEAATVAEIFYDHPRYDIGSAYEMIWDILNKNDLDLDRDGHTTLAQEHIDKVEHIKNSEFYSSLFKALIGHRFSDIHRYLENAQEEWKSNREYEPEHRNEGRW